MLGPDEPARCVTVAIACGVFTRPNLSVFNTGSSNLIIAVNPNGKVQNLMLSVPRHSSTWLERNACDSRACQRGCLKQRVNAHRAGKPIGRALLEGCEPILLISILQFLSLYFFNHR
jgi:hypothetical protein